MAIEFQVLTSNFPLSTLQIFLVGIVGVIDLVGVLELVVCGIDDVFFARVAHLVVFEIWIALSHVLPPARNRSKASTRILPLRRDSLSRGLPSRSSRLKASVS